MNTAPTEISQPVAGNPGETLRQARESKGWSVAEVATRLNLTPQRLGQIESGAFDKLPGTTFARGYIRAYAKLLELDQASLVKEFDQFTGTDSAGSNVHSLGRIEEPVRYSQSILRLVSFLLLLALVGAGFLWWQEEGSRVGLRMADLGIEHVEVDGADGTTQIHSLAEPEDQAVVAAQGDGAESPLLLPVEPGNVAEPSTPAAEPAPAEEAVAEAPVAAAEPQASQPAESEAATPPAAAPVEAVAAGQGALNVRFTADCWTQVTDADGKVLVSALKRAGENLALTGKAPMELRLGFARGAQVTYNGEAVDVSSFTTGETARLKLGL